MLVNARDAREATMADDNKGASNAKADSARADSAVKADVRAVNENEVRVDAIEHLSYKDYAAQFKKPIVTVQRLIERKGLPKPKLRSFVPNFEVKQVMKWGELPKEEPAKPAPPVLAALAAEKVEEGEEAEADIGVRSKATKAKARKKPLRIARTLVALELARIVYQVLTKQENQLGG